MKRLYDRLLVDKTQSRNTPGSCSTGRDTDWRYQRLITGLGAGEVSTTMGYQASVIGGSIRVILSGG